MPALHPTVVIKKYSNRRLYDTERSRYITLDELADTIQGGADVRVVDAKTNEDLTQSTLTQIILESRRASRLLPVSLLSQLIRMNDDALSEFFGRYMTWALELYLQAKQGANVMAPYNPFATLPFAAAGAMARFFNAGRFQGAAASSSQSARKNARSEPPVAEPDGELMDDASGTSDAKEGTAMIADLRREIDELKRVVLTREKR